MEEEHNILLHYNFSPYSTGQIGQKTGPKRRDIGHGHDIGRRPGDVTRRPRNVP